MPYKREYEWSLHVPLAFFSMKIVVNALFGNLINHIFKKDMTLRLHRGSCSSSK